MLTILWLKGLLAYRSGRLLGAVVGVALTVALLASIGMFISSSSASMTQRAAADVPVDWQVQLSPGTDANAVADAIGKATSYTALEEVGYANVAGFMATAGGTVQTTGAGKVLGLRPQYPQQFPKELRLLIGSVDGVLVAQQTASNLHVAVGDMITIQRVGLSPVKVKVGGIVDLPNADSLFQAVGTPASGAPQAPPDNVLVLPSDQWHQLFDPQATARPDSVRMQFHVRITRNLPTDPNTAFTYVQQLANNLEARVAGSAIVGNNLAARLDGVRKDALYALVLFLFLGLPGAILAILLTMAVATSGIERRRQEQALLRTRGAATSQILGLAALEAIIVGIGGVALGIALAYIAAGTIASVDLLANTTAILWTVNASLVGLILAMVAVLYPAWAEARHATVIAARAVVGRGLKAERKSLWRRIYLDVILLAIAAIVFWRTASTGYQVVLAPEGVPGTSVAYETFLAPLCLWVGVALLSMRLCGGGLEHGRRVLAGLLRPIAQKLSGVVSASLGRQYLRIARGIVLVALAFSFATSTSVFNTTYNAQSHVDAELTNGADVTVTGSTASAPSRILSQLRALPGVAAAQQTGTDAAEIVLIRADGSSSDLATRVRAAVNSLPGVQVPKVTDIGSTQRLISSSLTAIDLHGLTNLELTFAIFLVAGATGLILALGLAERRRTFALLAALGAKGNQLGAFLWSEGLLIQVAGGIIGIALGFGIAQMLVTILTGVFDPPPEVLSIPWLYLVLLVIAAAVSMIAAVLGTQITSRRPVVAALRDL